MPLNHDEKALLKLVPEDGSNITNPLAQTRLKWPDDRYWATRDLLVDKGLVVRGRGRGGTLKRVAGEEVVDVVTVPVTIHLDGGKKDVDAIEDSVRRELDLYDPMAKVLKAEWARDRRMNPLAVEITALQGRRATGGTWSRPDIFAVEIRTYAFVPGKHLEVITFEIKSSDSVNVQAVYEALAHRRSSTKSYVLLHVPRAAASALATAIDDVRTVSRSHGIGLIVADDPSDYNTWEELEEALRVEADPERLDNFIGTQLSERTRTKIATGLR